MSIKIECLSDYEDEMYKSSSLLINECMVFKKEPLPNEVLHRENNKQKRSKQRKRGNGSNVKNISINIRHFTS